MSGTKRPAGKDFDPPAHPVKQLRVEPPLSQPPVQTPPTAPAPSPSSQQFVLPVRHPLDTSRRLSQGARLIGIPGILPNVPRQPPPPLQPQSTFGFPSPASSLSPLGLPILPAGGLVGISPNPVTGVPHIRSPHPLHLPIPPPFPTGGVPPIGHTPHSHAPPICMVASYIPPDHHAVTTAQLGLIRPGSPGSIGLPPRSLLAGASPLTPPPPYPISPHPPSVGGATGEEFICASPSQFLRSPTSIASFSQPSSVESPLPSRPTPSSSERISDAAATATGLQKEKRSSVAPPPVHHGATRAGSKRDHHSVKTRLLKHQRSRLAGLKLRYEVQLKERFFLEGGCNMMDFLQWKKKPNALREQYLKVHDIDGDSTSTFGQLSPKLLLPLSSDVKTSQARLDTEHPLPPPESSAASEFSGTHHRPSKTLGAGGGTSRRHDSSSSSSSTRIQIPLSTVSPSLQVVSPLPTATLASVPPSTPSSTPSSPLKSLALSSPSPRPATRAQFQTQVSFSSVYETSHEDIVMRARHEAEVMRAIADLRKEGLWSTSRLPKVQEPSRRRSLWDFLLEEMQWLATDFANERRWKINAAKKVQSM